jgi:TPR repeat protein
MAWYQLAINQNKAVAYNNIGVLYDLGQGVSRNYFTAMEFYLKAARGNFISDTSNIVFTFLNGNGVPLDKYKALKWHCHGGGKSYRDKLKNQRYHRSATDKSKFNPTIDS